jgi:hypothetical protein
MSLQDIFEESCRKIDSEKTNEEMPSNEIWRNVKKLLTEKPSLRDNDTSLILAYWQEIDHANVSIITDKQLTKPCSIIRRRQQIQAEYTLLPTKEKVRHQRGKSK